MRFNGKAVPISGVTTVSTDAIHRNQGYLRTVITRHFEELHEGGERPLAVLFASQAAIYQRYGYGIVGTHYRYQVEPRYLQFAEPLEVPGRLREADGEREFGLLVDLYRRFREDKTGYVHRGKAMWDANALEPVTSREDVKTVLVYEELGQPLGYAIFTTGPGAYEGPEPGQKLIIHDLAWLNARAYRAFWEHFARQPLARYVTWGAVSRDDPLPHLILEPRMLRASWRDGLLARIVDLEASFRARTYPQSEALRFELLDRVCPWNTGQWQVITGADDAEVTPLRSGEVDITVTPATLAMLLFGQITASEAARFGRLDVHNPDALAVWDAALRTKWAPFTPDNW